VLAVIVFALMGQTLFGGEWLFDGAESKVWAYALVFAGLAAVLDGRIVVATLCFAAATYLHFLIGFFWFVAAMALRLIETSGGLQRVAAATSGFFLLVAPLLGAIAWSRLVDDVGPPGMAAPPVDVIYSIIRAPWHMAPFASVYSFRTQWLPGYLLAGGMI